MNSQALELELDLSDGSSASASTAGFAIDGPDQARVVLLQEDPGDFEQIKAQFRDFGWSAQMRRSASVQDFQECLGSGEWDCVLCFGGSDEFNHTDVAEVLKGISEPVRPNAIYVDHEYDPAMAESITREGYNDYLSITETWRLAFACARETRAKHNQRIASASETILAEAHAQSKLLLDSTADAISYVSDGVIVHANTQFCELLGFNSSEDVELQSLIDLVDPQEHATIKPIVKQMTLGNAEEQPPVTLLTLKACGESIPLVFHFADATYDGEACAQIIVRSEQQDESTGDSLSNAPADIVASNIAAAPLQTGVCMDALDGIGFAGFIALQNTSELRKNMPLSDFNELMQQLELAMQQTLPDGVSLSRQGIDSWLLAGNCSETDFDDDNAVGSRLANCINELTANAVPNTSKQHAAVGIARFGVAEMSADMALEKAFTISAELEGSSTGYKCFSPRIDNAEGSAALQSALQLNRFTAKFQPIIALQNQPEENYQMLIYVLNENGQESCAKNLLAELGIEEANTALDKWIIEHAIETLSTGIVSNNNARLIVPLTPAAITSSDFHQWIIDNFKSHGLDVQHLCFEINALQLENYAEACKQFADFAKSNGLGVVLTGINQDQLKMASDIKPSLAMLCGHLTQGLSADEEHNTRDALKETIAALQEQQVACIATEVSSASELALLWQTSIPFVQGNYLQAPLNAMNYEFAEIS